MPKKRTLKGVPLSTSECAGSTVETEDPNAPNEPFGETESDCSNSEDGPPQKRRGITTMSDVWNLPPGKRIVVNLDKKGHPIGRGSSLLSEFVGTVARMGDLCPVNDSNWKTVPDHVKADILKILYEKFNFHGRKMDKYLLQTVGRCRKGYRSKLKTTVYDKMHQAKCSIQEISEAVPERMVPEQWKTLVAAWSRPQAEKKSNMGKQIRQNVKYPHTAGSTNFATLANRFKTDIGRDPSRLERFAYQHKHKDGSFVNEEAAINHDKALKVVNDRISAVDDVSTPIDKVNVENEVFTQVFGPDKYGRESGVGYRTTQSTLGRVGSSSETYNTVLSMQKQFDDFKKMHEAEMERRDLEIMNLKKDKDRRDSEIDEAVRLQTEQIEARLQKSTEEIIKQMQLDFVREFLTARKLLSTEDLWDVSQENTSKEPRSGEQNLPNGRS